MRVRFEWDPKKARSNLIKHGVSFPSATRIFTDPFTLIEQDRVVEGEARWRAIGISSGSQMLFVAHTMQEDRDGEVIRIISARSATPRERKRYESANDSLRDRPC